MPRATPAGRAAYMRDFYARPQNAQKNSARHICKYAIESGKLVRQPCEGCGETKTEAHHDDYSKPLDVRWLCKTCHGKAHRRMHCIRGHELTDDNIYITPKGRICLACKRGRKLTTDTSRVSTANSGHHRAQGI